MLGDEISSRSASFSIFTAGMVSPPVWKETHELISALNSSVKNNGKGVDVNVGAGVNVAKRVAVAGSG